MKRRRILQLIGSAGVTGILPRISSVAVLGQPSLPYTVKGSGPAFITFDGALANLDSVTGHYRVIAMDYPPAEILNSQSKAVTDAFTPRVCADILTVADMAGANSFAYYGYSWGGVVGLQLATRTNRLSALVCGGWPPLGAPYNDMPNATGQSIFTTFYRSIQHWPEREAVSRIACPRLAFAGRDDVINAPGVTARIGPLLAEHREELEQMGWTVRLMDGFAHSLGASRDVIVPLIREFLDPLLLHG
jgi:pimeloyl-ACP methyl ester carboxylesterase